VSLWLLAIVQSCSKRQPVLNKRMTLQMAFTHLLSEDNELVQDVASRGLGLIFNMSSEQEQSQLSTQLLEQLTDGNKGKVRKVDDDTQLFEDGVLGKTPTGQNMTTYKELCSIASDLNHPEILYSFMQLANHNASWNSRLGAAFGLQSISAVAKEKLQPYLANIVPRLYRYKYDPTPKIQNSMIAIWDAIIISSKDTVEEYYWQIMTDVTANLTHPEWRTRIACCLAIRDLLKRPNGLRVKATVGDTEPELRELWLQLFRVMDDFHEGTREAAGGTAKVLSKLCAAAVSCDHGKRESFVICNTILPILLEPGCTHTVPDIRSISLKTISEIIDSSGDLIQPHLAILIPNLLKATGETEQQKLSMLSTMMSGQAESQEIVDSMRAEVAKNHYTIKTITKCIKYIDGEVFEKSTSAVLDLIKSSVNLGEHFNF
jgi:proteasome component ECM29